jgi:hypothetical protein
METLFASLYGLIDEATAAGVGAVGVLKATIFAIRFGTESLSTSAAHLRVLEARHRRAMATLGLFGGPLEKSADIYDRAAALIEAEDARSRAEHTMEVAP